ncbi:hypothetical protein CI610_00233 [invertebrate metagenome]|uniref:Uncharacterized protein n=1 Tax=invertebrate metagenome TaxID=1711999 RepID=A0A2H9TCH3_9ZZZZ
MNDPVFPIVAIQQTVEAFQIMVFVFQLRREVQFVLFAGLPERIRHAITPLLHEGRFREIKELPLGMAIVKPAMDDKEMNIHVPVKVMAKGLQGSEDTREHLSFVFGKGLNGFGCDKTQLTQQFAVRQTKYHSSRGMVKVICCHSVSAVRLSGFRSTR